MRTTVVIPTYNERATIGPLIRDIFISVPKEMNVIVVDDSSGDGTIEMVRSLQKHYPVTLIVRPEKRGLGEALKEGIACARAQAPELIITMDGDGSHDPREIVRFIETIKQGAEVVIGSRRIPGGKIIGWGPVRSCMSRGAMQFARSTLGMITRDVTSGFRAYRTEVFDGIHIERLRSTGYAFQEEILYRLEQQQFRVVEVPIVFRDRKEGKSKLGIRDIVDFFVTVGRLKFNL